MRFMRAGVTPREAADKIIAKAEMQVRNALFRPNSIMPDKGRCVASHWAASVQHAGVLVVAVVWLTRLSIHVQAVAPRPAVEPDADHRRVWLE